MDEEVLIKIAADISSAAAGMASLATSLDAIQKSLAGVGTEAEDTGTKIDAVARGMASASGPTDAVARGMAEAGRAASQAAVGIEEAGRSATDSVAAGLQLSQAYDAIKKGAVDLITSFPNMIMGAKAAGEQMDTMAKRLGVTAGAIDFLSYASDQSGVSMTAMAKTAQLMGPQMADPMSKVSQAFAQVGLNAQDLQKDPVKALFDFTEATQKTIDPAKQSAFFQDALGRSARGVTGLLKENVQELRENSAAYGLTAEEAAKLAESSDAMGDKMGNARLVIDTFEQRMAIALLPTLTAVVDKLPILGGLALTVGEKIYDLGAGLVPAAVNFAIFNEKGMGGLIEKAGLVKTGLKDMAGGMSTMATKTTEWLSSGGTWNDMLKESGSTLKTIGGSIVNFGKNLGGLIPMLTAATAQMWAMVAAALANPYVQLGIVIAALGVALYELMGGWEGIQKAMEPVIQLFKDLWQLSGDLAESLSGQLAAAWEGFKEFWNGLPAFIYNIWTDIVNTVTGKIDELVGVFDTGISGATGIFTGFRDAVVGVFETVIGFIQQAIDWLSQFPIVGDYIKAVQLSFEMLGAAAEKVFGWLKEGIQWVTGAWNTAATAISSVATSVSGAATAVVEGSKKAIAAIHEQAEASRAADKAAADAAATTTAATGQQVTALDLMMQKVADADKAYAALDKTQKSQIETLLAAGQSTKDIAEVLAGPMKVSAEVAQIAIDKYKKSLEAAKKAADKQSPWQKLVEDAKALAGGLNEATAAGAPASAAMEEFGKKASEVVRQAKLHKDGLKEIPPEVQAMAAAYDKAELDKKLKKFNDELDEWVQKMTMAAGVVGNVAIVGTEVLEAEWAAFTKNTDEAYKDIKRMQEDMTLNAMSESDRRKEVRRREEKPLLPRFSIRRGCTRMCRRHRSKPFASTSARSERWRTGKLVMSRRMLRSVV